MANDTHTAGTIEPAIGTRVRPHKEVEREHQQTARRNKVGVELRRSVSALISTEYDRIANKGRRRKRRTGKGTVTIIVPDCTESLLTHVRGAS